MMALAMILALAAMCTVSYLVVPSQCSWLPQCQFHRFTGLYCPGCGNTRALHALVHGDIIKSLHCNVLLIPVTVCIMLLIYSRNARLRLWVSYTAGAVIILFGIVRNLPWKPFTLLLPP